MFPAQIRALTGEIPEASPKAVDDAMEKAAYPPGAIVSTTLRRAVGASTRRYPGSVNRSG